MENMNKPLDRRIVRTKKAIKNAVTELLALEEPDKISITDLARKAGVNRKTFYGHYKDVENVIDEIENDVKESFDDMLAPLTLEEIIENPGIIFAKLTDMIAMDPAFYGRLLSTSRNSSLTTKIGDSFRTKIKEIFARYPLDQYQADLMIDFVASGVVTVFRNWIADHHGKTLDELCHDMSVLTYDGLKGFFQQIDITPYV